MPGKQTLHRLIIPGLILIAFGSAFYKTSHSPASAKFLPPASVVSNQSAPRFETHFASSKLFAQVHAASGIELKDGGIRAFWFSGSREGAKDVAIHSAVFDPATSQWGGENIVVSREQIQQALHRYVAKLGNPVVGRMADGTLRMFYVTVSLGGWAGSSITTLTSRDEGATWSEARRMITSPFINISTLVKGAPFLYSDGTIGLPVYHEFISKFAELLRVNQDGIVLDKQRWAAGGQGTLQPVVLIQNAQAAQVLMRYSGAAAPHRVVTVSTQDAGQHWSPPTKSALRNPDAAVTGVTLPDERMLAVLNDQEQGRDTLSLMLSTDGGSTWRMLQQLEDQQAASAQADEARYLGNAQTLIQQSDAATAEHLADYVESTKRTVCKEGRCRYEFSYPYLIQMQRGDFHLVYTWNRTFIKHLWFNQAWLDQRLKESANDAPH
ncbi:MAG: BNR/Asp-box repeat-containing [Gallionellaceae bacterium]|nr:MAG: BNR/Asp-box repeat-containing [Gallionellaceae bacterium]